MHDHRDGPCSGDSFFGFRTLVKFIDSGFEMYQPTVEVFLAHWFLLVEPKVNVRDIGGVAGIAQQDHFPEHSYSWQVMLQIEVDEEVFDQRVHQKFVVEPINQVADLRSGLDVFLAHFVRSLLSESW